MRVFSLVLKNSTVKNVVNRDGLLRNFASEISYYSLINHNSYEEVYPKHH